MKDTISMLNVITGRRIALLPVLVSLSSISCSGCLHYLGQSHSSLAPRTTAIKHTDPTIRSQDAYLSSMSQSASTPKGGYAGIAATTIPEEGHAAPVPSDRKTPGVSIASAKARLLQPQFGSRANNKAPLQQPAKLGHSVPVTSAQLRRFMNQQSESEMSNGTVLTEQSVDPAATNDPQSSQRPAIESPPQSQLFSAEPPPRAGDMTQAVTTGNTVVATPATFGETEPPVQEASAVDSTMPEERSVFDRLKGLYETPRDADGRSLWKRQIDKLQATPWVFLRDRGASETQAAGEISTDVLDPEGAAESLTLNGNELPQSSSALLPFLIESVRSELDNWPRSPSGALIEETRYRSRQQDLRLLYLVANEPGAAIASMDSVSDQEQEFWQELMLALAQYRSDEPGVTDQERLTSTVGQLLSAVEHLKPLTSLSIQRLEICSQIKSFGRVETFADDFDPGAPISLYLELENFGTERTGEGTYRTSVDAELAIFRDGSSEQIETMEFPNVGDEATSLRRDYFQVFEFYLPSHLASGRYRIRVRLRDRITGKLAESSIDFQVREQDAAS